MSDPGEWCERHGRVHGEPASTADEWWDQADEVLFGPSYIRMRTPTDDELSRLRGMAETAFKLQKNLMAHGFTNPAPGEKPSFVVKVAPQKHRPFIPAWLPCLLLGCALMVAAFSELREAPLALALLVFAAILMPGATEGLREKREDKAARYWREIAALEMDIYGEYVSSETMRRFGGGLPQ